MTQTLDSALLANFGVQNNQIVCDTGEVLAIVSIARVLPNQRIVCKCLFNAKNAYAKIFIGLRANVHAAREVAGTKLLAAANILTPDLLLQTTSQNQPVIVYAAIENAVNAEDFMHQNDAVLRREMAKKLVQTVAHHHNANLIQTDIHLKNFLIAGVKAETAGIYTIDGDGVEASNSKIQKQRNLATFLSKFDVLDDSCKQANIDAYCAVASEKLAPNFLQKIYISTQIIRQKTASDYADKKVFRTCTDVEVRREQGSFFALNTQYSQANIACTPYAYDHLIMLAEPLLKNGNTATVAKITVNNQLFVLKRYNIKNTWHALTRALRPSRAAASWANAYRLHLLGITTAKPVALLETRKFGLRGKAYFLAEYIDAPDVAQFFAQTRDKSQRAEAIKNISTLFYKLYLLKISHGDMKATNILMPIKMQVATPTLIDLDSMQQHASINHTAHVRDLRRFMQNWQNDNALYNAFVITFKVVYADHAPLIAAGIATNKELA